MEEPRFLAHVVEQHLESAASLWLIRDNAVRRSAFRLVDLAKLDARVEAHLDGLRVATWNGWQGAHEELERADAGEFFASGVIALESGEPARSDQLIASAHTRTEADHELPYHAAADPWRGIVSALAWIGSKSARPELVRLLSLPDPRCRWLAIASAGARRDAELPGLETALSDPEPLVRARAARAMGELGRRDQQDPLCTLLRDENGDVRFWAAWSGTRLRVSRCTSALAEFAMATSPQCDQALDLLCRGLAIDHANALLRQLRGALERRRTLISAVGAIGDAVYLPWLVRQAAEPSSARAALASFALMTGLITAEVHGEAPPDARQTVNDDPQEETVVPDDADALPWPDAERLAQWWHANQGRFNPGTAYFLGSPKMSAPWLDALTNAPQWLRRMAALELALRMPTGPIFEVRARASAQQQLLRQVNTSNR